MARRKKRKSIFNFNTIFVLFIIFMMTFSVVGYMLDRGDSNGSGSYNGYKFTNNGYAWLTEYDDKIVSFGTHPSYIENIEFPKEAESFFRAQPYWAITFNPEDESIQQVEKARADLETASTGLFNVQIFGAVTQPSAQYPGFTVVDCMNASSQFPVIKFEKADNREFVFDNYCLTIRYDTSDSVNIMKERLIYGITGIIESK